MAAEKIEINLFIENDNDDRAAGLCRIVGSLPTGNISDCHPVLNFVFSLWKYSPILFPILGDAA
jgi:hypothetical protein